MSANNERFQPPKLWNAIGIGIGTLTPTMPIVPQGSAPIAAPVRKRHR
jgi:hypothetical protein